jgi:NodT family efflux transporter outer membrane factor (OMF) lipoprotein
MTHRIGPGTMHAFVGHPSAMRTSICILLLPALLAACALPAPPPTAPDAAVPTQWQAPRPADDRMGDLAAWWSQFDDPALAQLVAAAEDVSPSIASARSRLEQARAARVAAGAALLPEVAAGTSTSRGRQDLATPITTTSSGSLQASWEIDLFGGNRAGATAAQARQDAAQALWHDARTSVAAEVATQYTSLRACEAQLLQTQADAASRAETARLTSLTSRSGLQSSANADLANASAAQGRATVSQQRAQCELAVKALVALTGIDEAALRARLAGTSAHVPQPLALDVPAVPAQALAQRPDLAAAERDVVAAGADVAQAQADRLPRIALRGSIGHTRIDTGAARIDGNVWSFGPLSVSLPVFDGGARVANVQAARARYDDATVQYGARLRDAVREVEQALVTLQSTGERAADAQAAAEGFRASYLAAQARYGAGLASLFELEDARRDDVQAQSALIDLQRERVHAWISLYRALGGGWTPRLA